MFRFLLKEEETRPRGKFRPNILVSFALLLSQPPTQLTVTDNIVCQASELSDCPELETDGAGEEDDGEGAENPFS